MKHYLSMLEEQMASRWHEPALCTFKSDSYTFEDIAVSIEKFHICFELTGICKGDKIALCARNSARWAIAFLAVNTYEAVAVPILSEFRPEDISSLVNHSESKVLFTDDTLFEKLDLKKMPLVQYIISLNDFSVLYATDSQLQQALDNRNDFFRTKHAGGFTASDVHYPVDNMKELAAVNYTSGTTSAPKGVMLRYDSFCSNVLFALKVIPPKIGDTVVCMLPLAHMYGFMIEFLFPLCCGATIYFLGKAPTPTLLFDALQTVRPYLIITVPMVMEKIFKQSVQPVLNNPKVRSLTRIPFVRSFVFRKLREKMLKAFGGNITTIILGGAALNPEVEKWFLKIRLPFTIGYGMTEAAPLLAYEDWRRFVPSSCGKPVDRVEIRIDSKDPQHQPGEILARGVNLMCGYYKNSKATEASFTRDGWMRTGDLGIMDTHGNVFIRGRNKTMILGSNGQNIYPEELESVINSQPYVVESLVVERNERLVALVFLSETALSQNGITTPELISGQLAQILDASNRNLPSYSRISKIEAVDKPFEKTPKMNIRRILYQ